MEDKVDGNKLSGNVLVCQKWWMVLTLWPSLKAAWLRNLAGAVSFCDLLLKGFKVPGRPLPPHPMSIKLLRPRRSPQRNQIQRAFALTMQWSISGLFYKWGFKWYTFTCTVVIRLHLFFCFSITSPSPYANTVLCYGEHSFLIGHIFLTMAMFPTIT